MWSHIYLPAWYYFHYTRSTKYCLLATPRSILARYVSLLSFSATKRNHNSCQKLTITHFFLFEILWFGSIALVTRFSFRLTIYHASNSRVLPVEMSVSLRGTGRGTHEYSSSPSQSFVTSLRVTSFRCLFRSFNFSVTLSICQCYCYLFNAEYHFKARWTSVSKANFARVLCVGLA